MAIRKFRKPPIPRLRAPENDPIRPQEILKERGAAHRGARR